jgi:hypothetical protein
MNPPGASSPPFRRELKRQCLNNCRNEQRLRPRCQRLARLPSPSKELLWRQPMSTRNSTNKLPARHGLGDDPRLVLGTPRPPSPGPVKTSMRRASLVSALCSVTILSPTLKWTPQTHRAARPAKGGSATALTLNRSDKRAQQRDDDPRIPPDVTPSARRWYCSSNGRAALMSLLQSLMAEP